MQSIKEIKNLLENCSIDEYNEYKKMYQIDSRKGVQSLITTCEKKIAAYEKEQRRLEAMLFYEKEYYKKGYCFVAGVDEVGRGPLAGPVVAGAVILPKDCKIEGVNDSKKLSEAKRELLYTEICEKAIAYSVGIVSHQTIDSINILQATYLAMQKALETLNQKPDFVLVDAVTIPNISMGQRGIIKGDEKSISIAAASIIAKVTRDHMMQKMHTQYPAYAFDKNKGYGSKEHIEAIEKVGICEIHRHTFVKNFIK